MKITELTLELIVGFILLFLVVKVAGKKLIHQITPFTFISVIVLGELLGNALYADHVHIWYIIYSITLWGALLLFVEYINQKWLAFRLIAEGKPTALIRNGIIDYEALKKARLTLNQLQSLLRQNETFSIREVAFCYLEADGSLSILKKSSYQKPKKEDFHFPPQPVHIPTTIIRDGQLLMDELRELEKSEEWLLEELRSREITDYKHVLIAEWLEGDGLFVQTYQ
ncbi:DUF421 domain-containing protein [Anoxybacillus rupiensis]|jgi:uncharacterized membrane protein YcaP (DUF421 family)|uniref:DUF421 domain-containing protein n=1 Tax=Anoxybacteroides rupiense TaxID=311460 RepID=A0ABD5IX44_9BACL|nr:MULTISPECIES: DUF421 domain-containing protein [Anoxybacillus]MBB3908494.1 uncharacterized membrane protein YcaP (DUF421 family) [Anoxybacillus rupiensis]MBS2770887.1 DUF421 domain-containing protein [Anoxybacillus rupiensis]MDE8563601.1 DUF421 domain-containing protein [Anoxybacillus rupiensis]MED5052932.1 DUF421 domain-containing protein [Anoxybacillus rupiensis]OQM44651.1 hypothetical protein B6A27_15250 [Anoxybacillus sp. UARK-01]